MRKLLLDTSIIVDFLRVKHKEKTLFTLLLKHRHDLCVSIVTHTELYSGKSVWEQNKALQELEDLFSEVEILPLNYEISKKAGNIKAFGTIDLIDAIIAATALYHDLELVTLNSKDFGKVENLKVFEESFDLS